MNQKRMKIHLIIPNGDTDKIVIEEQKNYFESS